MSNTGLNGEKIFILHITLFCELKGNQFKIWKENCRLE